MGYSPDVRVSDVAIADMQKNETMSSLPRIQFRMVLPQGISLEKKKQLRKKEKRLNTEAKLAWVTDKQLQLYAPSLREASQAFLFPERLEDQFLLSKKKIHERRLSQRVGALSKVFGQRRVRWVKKEGQKKEKIEVNQEDIKKQGRAVVHAQRVFQRLQQGRMPTLFVPLEENEADRVASIMADGRHDMVTPLTTTSGSIQLLKRLRMSPEREREFQQQLGTQIEKLLKIPYTTQALSAYASKEAYTIQVNMSLSTMQALLEKYLEKHFEGKVVTGRIPPHLLTETIYTSPMLLDIVAKHVGTNARKGVELAKEQGAMSPEQEALLFEICDTLSDQFLIMEISNNGAQVQYKDKSGNRRILLEGEEKPFDGTSSWHGSERIRGTGDGGLVVNEMLKAEFGDEARMTLRGRKQGGTAVIQIPLSHKN